LSATRRLAIVPGFVAGLAATLAVAPVGSAARVPNACALLTRAQAEAALGAKLQWAQRQGDKLSSVCTFHGEPYNASSYAQPTLNLILGKTTPAGFRTGFNLSATAVRVRGLGDSAYTTSGNVRTLNVLRKGYALTVMVPPDKNLKWAKTVAGEAIARL
jgi:hypothetical protein